MSKSSAKKLAISVGQAIAGIGLVKGSVNIISSSLTLNFPTVVIGKAIQGITSALLTRIAGHSFIKYFEQDQSWGKGGIRDILIEQYKILKKEDSLNSFISSTLNRSVNPIEKDLRKELPPQRMPLEEEEPFDL